MENLKNCGDGSSMGKFVMRQVHTFYAAESRGNELLEILITSIERLHLIRERQKRGVPLPGNLAMISETIDSSLGPKLQQRLAQRAERALEQLRQCLEELEVVSRTVEDVVDKTFVEEEVNFVCGQEYWRKRQLLQAVNITDPLEALVALQHSWNQSIVSTFLKNIKIV